MRLKRRLNGGFNGKLIAKTGENCYTRGTDSQAGGCWERNMFMLEKLRMIFRTGRKTGERKEIMFDTMKVAKRIREARIAQNMTQTNLADAMGVSYQAVSNWERGNSMPDISKLEDLCGVLRITVEQLLGMESKETAAIAKVLKEETVTVEELAEIAPMLPPDTIKAQAEKSAGEPGKKYNIAALAEIAPYLDDDFLEELVESVEVESLEELEPLAAYLDEDVLDRLVRKAPRSDVRGIAALAPYLNEDTLSWLVLERDAELDSHLLEELGPYLEEDTLDALAERQIAKGNVKCLSGLYCYMDDETVHKIAKFLMTSGDLEELREAAHYL